MELTHLQTVQKIESRIKIQSIDSRITTKKSALESAPIGPSNMPDREHFFAELGQTGDSFGGLNALLTALAGALVGWAGFMQHQTLRQAREEAKRGTGTSTTPRV